MASPSTAPPGIPSSNNSKYVALALLLLLLIGGAVVWKLNQQGPEPVVTTIDAGPPPPPTTGRNLEDEVPLPPPVEDASAEAPRKIVTVVSNGCDKKCVGTSTSELEQMLAFRVKTAHRCYDQALAQDPTLKGKMSVAVRIGTNGAVCQANIASNDLGNQGVASCVLNSFRGANFPNPKGGCVDVNIPINFVPRQ